MAESMVPAWFQPDVYYQNKLSGGDAEALNAALLAAGYSLDVQGLYRHFVDHGNNEGVSPNPLFDTQKYLRNKTADAFGVNAPTDEQMASMAAAIFTDGMTIWEHYCIHGWREGINPSDAFDGNQYLWDKSLLDGRGLDQIIQDFQKAGFNPISHYYACGMGEGLSAKPVVLTVPAWFEWEAYYQNKLASMEDGWTPAALNKAFEDAGYSVDAQGMYRHFLDYGNDENISPNSVFDPQDYLIAKTADFFGVENPTAAQMAEVAALIDKEGMTLWDHYCQYGWAETVIPSDTFDANQYIEAAAVHYDITVDQMIQKLKDEGINPVMHYLMYDIGWDPSDPVPTNARPVIAGIPAQTTQLSVGDTINLADFTVSDADGDELTVTLTAVNGTLGGVTDADPNTPGIQLKGSAATINAALKNLTFTATQAGNASVGISVTDGKATTTASYKLSTPTPTDPTDPDPIDPIDPVTNTPPVIAGIPTQATQLSVGETINLADFTVSDADGDDLVVTLTVSGGTLGGVTDADPNANGIQLKGTAATINAALKNLTFTATTYGNRAVYISVTDGTDTTTATYNLFTPTPTDPTPVDPVDPTPVDPVNTPPVITNIPAEQKIIVGQMAELADFTVYDADNDNLTVTLTAANGTIFDADGNPLQLPLTGTAGEINAKLAALKFTATNAGEAKITITVTDGKGGTDTKTYKLNATDPVAVNTPPVITNVPTDQNIIVGQMAELADFTVSDADGDNLTVTLTAANGTIFDADGNPLQLPLTGTAGEINAKLAALKFTATNAGEAKITITVTDGRGGTATAIYKLLADTSDSGITYTGTDMSGNVSIGGIVKADDSSITVDASGNLAWTGAQDGSASPNATLEAGKNLNATAVAANGTGTLTIDTTATTVGDIYGSTDASNIIKLGNALNVVGGSNNDTITVQTGGKVTGNIYGGAGADNISVSGTVDHISGGDDDDTISVSGTVTNGISGGGGVDTINVAGEVTSNIDGEAGNDIITVENGGKVTGNIYGGDDNDTITVKDGGKVTSNIYGVGGADKITVAGIIAGFIHGDDDNDIITVENGGMVNGYIDGGDDNDTITVKDGGKVDYIYGEAGNDIITVQTGGTVTGEIWGGGGADTINLNNQQATIGILLAQTGEYNNPGGSNTVDLSGIDRIDKPGSGTTLNLYGNWTAGTTLTRNTTLVDVSNDTIQWIQGTVNADNTFTANDTGTDALIVYDADDTAGFSAQAVVLTGLTGSALKGVMTDGGLTITKNAAPVIDLASMETNNVIVGQAADLPNFTVSDADGDDLKITLKAVNGQICCDGFSWADTIKMGFDQAKDINDALADLQFKAAQAGDASITIEVTDKWGGTDSKIYNYLKATDPVVNTAPTISGIPKALQRISFETETALADFKVSDAENNNLTVTLAASGGDLSGVTDADDQEAGIQLKGSASAITNALANLKFKTTTQGDASISITVQDEYGATSAATYALFTPYDTTLDLGNDEFARVIGNSNLNYSFTGWSNWLSFTDPVIVDAEKDGNKAIGHK